MEDSQYLFLSSEDSKEKHPGNGPEDFTIELPRPLTLEGNWVCGVREVKFPNSIDTNTIYICTDICQESLVCDTYSPVIRMVNISSAKATKKTLTFTDPFYVKVKRDRLQRLRIFIRGERLRPTQITNGVLSCTIHLKRI